MIAWMGKKVLLTGITGLLAPHIGVRLANLGATVVGTYHDEKPFTYLSTAAERGRITLAQCDINSLPRLQELISTYEIDFVFHCAAQSIVRQCVTNPIGAFATNIIGTANVLEAARLVGGVSGIMCMESDKSYGSFDEADLPYREGQVLKPHNVYEVSKACSGLIADAYSNNFEMPVFTIRAANLYGPGDLNVSRLIPGSVLRLLQGRPPVLYSGVSEYIREFLYVTDAADAIINLMERIDDTRGHVFNLGSGCTVSISDLLQIIIQRVRPGCSPRVIDRDAFFKEISKQYVSFEKLKGVLPEYQPRGLLEGLEPTIEWYRENLLRFPEVV